MTKVNPVLIPILILLFLFVGCNSNTIFNLQGEEPIEPGTKVQQKSISILHMSDLDIIKKSADYLNSKGENLVFMETQILYESNPDLSPIFEDSDRGEISYKGNYLAVHFYPPTFQEDESFLTVFIDEDGKVLGYTHESG